MLTLGSGWLASQRGTAVQLWCGSPQPSLRTGDREKMSGHSSQGCGQTDCSGCVPTLPANRVQAASRPRVSAHLGLSVTLTLAL